MPEEKFGSKTLCKNCRQVDLQPPPSENPAAASSSGLDSGTPSVYIEHIFAFCIVLGYLYGIYKFLISFLS